MGNVAGDLGIPCKDFGNGCNCGQCKRARGMHKTVSNAVADIGVPCKDFGNGCNCEQCRRARGTHQAVSNVVADMGIPCKDFGGGCQCNQCTNARAAHKNGTNGVTNEEDRKSCINDLCEEYGGGFGIPEWVKGIINYTMQNRMKYYGMEEQVKK